MVDFVKTVKPKKKSFFDFTGSSETVHSDITKKGMKITNNLYIDMEETLTSTFDHHGNTINSSVFGKIVSKSFLKGSPLFKLKFSPNLVFDPDSDYGVFFDDMGFHGCVNDDSLQVNRTLEFTPPAGSAVLVQYRLSNDFDYPFKLNSFLNKKSGFKYEMLIKVSLERRIKPTKLDSRSKL